MQINKLLNSKNCVNFAKKNHLNDYNDFTLTLLQKIAALNLQHIIAFHE